MDKLDRIEQKLHEIDKTLSRNTDSLEYHVARTDALEDKLKPIQSHVLRVEGAVKLVVAIVAIAAFLKQMGVI